MGCQLLDYMLVPGVQLAGIPMLWAQTAAVASHPQGGPGASADLILPQQVAGRLKGCRSGQGPSAKQALLPLVRSTQAGHVSIRC